MTFFLLERMNLPVFFLALFMLICFSGNISAEITSPNEPVYRVPLRVHLGKSSRPPEQWLPILEEINTIWLAQAGICFEMQTVNHDETMTNGLDLWFESAIPDWNGYYTDHNDMHVRDDPDLRPARNPALSSAARTAAHELGHALNLHHRQDSDENLMRSKTYGWKLHQDEIETARANAKIMALPLTGDSNCTIQIGNIR